MHIYFSGIGGVGLGPLAEIALDAGHTVAGSDPKAGLMTEQLKQHGVTVDTDQSGAFLHAQHEQQPVDWFVYTSALPADHPELLAAQQLGIRTSKRDELLAHIIAEKGLKLIAVAGTHGKTTTTALFVWAFQQLGVPVSYSVGTTLSFAPSGRYVPHSEYFVYECDEYDRNFLQFHPFLAVIPSLSYDHPDTYPTQADYTAAFGEFLRQSEGSILWRREAEILGDIPGAWILGQEDIADVQLPGEHIRRNASLVVKAFERLGIAGDAIAALSSFPGADRRFEKLADNLYTDYAVHPREIAATIAMARELSGDVTVVYQPHQNVRQHEVRPRYTADIFAGASAVYWLPTYLTRENPDLPTLTPQELAKNVQPEKLHVAALDDALWEDIQRARDRGSLVLCMGAGTIDGWVRQNLTIRHVVNALILDKQGSFVLQQRDNKPGINNPGEFSGFGGKVEPSDLSLRSALLRELSEETNLVVNSDDLTFYRVIRKTEADGSQTFVTYFLLQDVDTTNLEIYEGQGFVTVPPNKINAYPLTHLVRSVIQEYTGTHEE